MSMNGLVGHRRVVAMLDRSVAENRVRHAYLFAGPAGLGKTTLARWLALRLNCIGDTPPCGDCRHCRRILAASHPDVRSLQAAAERDAAPGLAIDAQQRATRAAERVISIDQVRALQHDASLAPHEARWKVYVVVRAESLSLEAANCLLKTLEEPPERVVLALTVVDPTDLPSTVVSRCQVIRLVTVPAAEIASSLVAEHGCDPERADLLARLSGGRPGWAIEAAMKPALLEARTRAIEDLDLTLGRGFRDRLSVAERLAGEFAKDQGKILRTLTLWQLYWWDVHLIQRGCGDLITNVDQRDALAGIAERVEPTAVQEHLQRLNGAAQRLLHNVNPRLALEALLVAGPIAR